MKRLYLLRHAKSSWSDPEVADRERPLNGRGRRAAKAMAKHLRAAGVDPELVLCSPARRARDTLERIEPALGQRTVRLEERIYGAGDDELLELLRALPARVGSAMLIGHNPGLQDLALTLARPSALRDQAAVKFPTAALATLEFDADAWTALAPGSATLTAFVRPRDLTASA